MGNLFEKYKHIVEQIYFCSDENSAVAIKRELDQYLNNICNDTAESFIRTILEKRKKEDSWVNGEKQFLSVNDKAAHSVSLYLLGWLFSPWIERYFEKAYKEYGLLERVSPEETVFSFLWFISTFTHDFASKYEVEWKEHDKQTSSELSYDIYSPILNDDITKKTLYRPIPTVYERRLVDAYKEYRRASGKHDHGILSGEFVFNELADLCMKNMNAAKQYGYSTDGTVVWTAKLLSAYAFAADAIIAHNIWHTSAKTKGATEYLKYGGTDRPLSRLLDGNAEHKRISVVEHPLAFYLGLLDTIEPIKYFSEESPEKVLKEITIKMEQSNGMVKLCISQSADSFSLAGWFDSKIASLPLWMDIDSVMYDSGMITIKFYAAPRSDFKLDLYNSIDLGTSDNMILYPHE